MPPSRLIENLKYGGTGFSAISYSSGRKFEGQTSRDAVFEVDWPIEERLYVMSDGSVILRTLAWHRDFIDHGMI